MNLRRTVLGVVLVVNLVALGGVLAIAEFASAAPSAGIVALSSVLLYREIKNPPTPKPLDP